MLMTQPKMTGPRHTSRTPVAMPKYMARNLPETAQLAKVGSMLRDMAFVLAMTQKVKQEILQGSAAVV